VVILNAREESKLKTRKLILEKTALLLEEKGFYKISTKEIADSCKLSQGSLFLHFQTKENLLNTIFNQDFSFFENKLSHNCKTNISQELFLKYFLDAIIESENFLSRVYKDLPYLNDLMKKDINGLETTIKNLFFDNIRHNSKQKPSIIDTFISIDAFYSQIHRNFIEKDTTNLSNSIIKQKRGKLVKLYRTLFE